MNLTESSVAIWLASCMGNKAETAVHSCHCPGDMVVRMRKVLASQAVGWCSSGPFAFIVVFLHMVRRMDGWLAPFFPSVKHFLSETHSLKCNTVF